MRRLRFRFSLRTLLLLVALAALGCHWLSLPTRHADEFCRAMAAGDYERVEGLFEIDGDSGMNDGGKRFPGDWGTDQQIREATVHLSPLSWRDVWENRRTLFVHVPYGSSQGEYDWDIIILATPRGLRVVLAMT